MRKTFGYLLVLAIISISSPLSASGTDASPSSAPLITEVDPGCEGFTLGNYGSSAIDLRGYSITDGEGTLTFVSSFILSPGGSVTVSKSTGTCWFDSRPGVLTYPSDIIAKNRTFILADAGDELSLMNGSSVIDSVCYGKSQGVEKWYGDPVDTASGRYLLRVGGDSDRESDWISTKPGWTNRSAESIPSFRAEVGLFTFPESRGMPILETLSEAHESIDISIYLITSPELISLLCQKSESGIRVRVLAEGFPLGTDLSREISLLRSLTDSGGDVRFINATGSDDRFVYLHNKYAVIDGSVTVLTSENWTSGNLGEYGNRGWGAVIRSDGYASYMSEVFENDFFSQWGDVSGLLALYPNSNPLRDLPAAEITPSELFQCSATVTPVLSPDNSFVTIKRFMDGACERLYAEQMDLGSDLAVVSGDSPTAWMASAAERGVDTKFILDASQASASKHVSYAELLSSATSVQAIAMNGSDKFSLIHNKGVIADDKVWLGSVNWTTSSFLRNRETAVIIDSPEAADYYAGFFLEDFGVNIFTAEEEGLSLKVETFMTSAGEMVLLSVNGPSGYTYEWSLGDGTVRITEACAALFLSPSPGVYTATVRMLGSDLMSTAEYRVEQGSSEDHTYLYGSVAAAVAVLILGILSHMLRGRTPVPRKKCRSRFG